MEGLFAQLFGILEPCVLERRELTFQMRYPCLLFAEGDIIRSIHLEQLGTRALELSTYRAHLAFDRRALLLEVAQLALQGNGRIGASTCPRRARLPRLRSPSALDLLEIAIHSTGHVDKLAIDEGVLVVGDAFDQIAIVAHDE